MIHDFCNKFLQRLRYLQNEGTGLLSSGKAQTFEEYKYFCGKLRGLNAAENIVMTLMKEIFEGTEISEDIQRSETNEEHDLW